MTGILDRPVSDVSAPDRLCWIDLRASEGEERAAILTAALHAGADAVLAADTSTLDGVPPSITRVLVPAGSELPVDLGVADLVLVDPVRHGEPSALAGTRPGHRFGAYVEVSDAESLAVACASARRDEYTVVRFRDPTHIPLEIVLAAAADATGTIVTVVSGPDEAAVHAAVLEHGPAGFLLATTAPADVLRLLDVVAQPSPDLALTVLTVTAVRSAGTGERACIDTCSYLRKDEGILVGSRARGLVLCVSETHPLPYMPTRPFRVNAGAVMSYTLADHHRTRYLSELAAGGTVLAVGADGRTRRVTVGRIKIETRPLLSVDAVAPDGETVNLIVQNDWHVRVLGPGAAVLNSTELRPGNELLGYLPRRERHVGYPIDELCYEL